MKKIALIIDSLDKSFPESKTIKGGGNKVNRHLIEELVKRDDVELDIICGISSFAEFDGVKRIISLGFSPFKDMGKFFDEVKKIVDENGYDSILSSDLFTPFGNVIIHCHSFLYRYKNHKNPLWTKFLEVYNRKKISVQKKRFTSENNHYIAVSNDIADDYALNIGVDREKFITVYPGVENEEEFVKNKLNDVFTFGIYAGGGSNKGGYLFLKALSLLTRNIDYKVKIIHPKFKKDFVFKFLLKLYGLQDKVQVIPYQQNMADFYKSVDCFILPSLNEAFGLVVLEAAALSVPTIVSSTAGASEIIEDGVNGFVFDRKNNPQKALKDKLLRVVELYKENPKKWENIRENSFELSKQFSWKKFCEEIVKNI